MKKRLFHAALCAMSLALPAFADEAADRKVAADLNRKGTIYDLFGRKVTKATKGLYIKDGKKFFIK